MLEYRILTDFDIEKIIDYSNEQEFVNSADLYVSERLIIEPFRRESSLRPILFEGRIIFYAEIEENNIKKVAFIALPDPMSKSNVVNILHMSTEKVFIGKTVDFLKSYFKDSSYSKIRLAYYEKEYNKDFATKLLNSGFECEVDFSPALNNKKMLCLRIDKEIE
ncbi:hypothetical protein [Thermoanaerobacterium thermosaccharolyticum]|uniref:hypothetical protein n=1 Tax=Thermoanaerobacterium thermosaccharolyticum TaxID=1517 RepID=UPI0005EDC342|nr:hypothetical protein [Thermoanaerobacterium thermosaccharolyticum]KAA5806613.1 hypothetical protein F1655_09125 [Thermoanaerobacterium thermosaccharolyticum]